MNKVKIIRYETGDEGTFSAFIVNSLIFHLIELPNRGNQQSISCIPAGEYECEVVESPKFGHVYHVKDVPNRSHILIHSGNYAGDKAKGFKTNSYGCLLPGMKRGTLSGQKVVLSSRDALNSIMTELGDKPFKLIIKEVY